MSGALLAHCSGGASLVRSRALKGAARTQSSGPSATCLGVQVCAQQRPPKTLQNSDLLLTDNSFDTGGPQNRLYRAVYFSPEIFITLRGTPEDARNTRGEVRTPELGRGSR